jgi:DNA adenine methylase
MVTRTSDIVAPRPFLKWAGGKRRLIPQYECYIPQNFGTYYEPFLGGGAMFFYLSAKPAVLTDINEELINTYCSVRDDVDGLIQLLSNHQENHQRSPQQYYYQIRSSQPRYNLARAARFIYLNKTCFNGLYRVNSQGKFNVPIGRYKNPKICDRELLRSVSDILQQTIIEVKPFTAVLDPAKADDFVYFDPPYHPISTTSNFTAYSRHSFNQDSQIQLRDTFQQLAEKKVKVMLSNSDCALIRDIYREFKIHKISAARSINSHGKKRGKISELLITSY